MYTAHSLASFARSLDRSKPSLSKYLKKSNLTYRNIWRNATFLIEIYGEIQPSLSKYLKKSKHSLSKILKKSNRPYRNMEKSNLPYRNIWRNPTFLIEMAPKRAYWATKNCPNEVARASECTQNGTSKIDANLDDPKDLGRRSRCQFSRFTIIDFH